jgi:hypothetical protein
MVSLQPAGEWCGELLPCSLWCWCYPEMCWLVQTCIRYYACLLTCYYHVASSCCTFSLPSLAACLDIRFMFSSPEEILQNSESNYSDQLFNPKVTHLVIWWLFSDSNCVFIFLSTAWWSKATLLLYLWWLTLCYISVDFSVQRSISRKRTIRTIQSPMFLVC